VATISFRFYAQLNDFLARIYRHRRFLYTLPNPASVKDTIEAIGVPHPEVDLILVDSEPVDFSRLLGDGDAVSVYPLFRSIDLDAITRAGVLPPQPAHFIIDAHLSKLASWLRLAGFDAIVLGDDAEIAETSARETRIVLTRDLALLKRCVVRHGRWIRNTDPELQLAEVLQHFDLLDRMQPFTRCTQCNTRVRMADVEAVADRLHACTRAEFIEFHECPGCGRVYWQGSHFARLRAVLDRAVARARPDNASVTRSGRS
jgi:uncharacterized protein with PIN domain